MKLRSLLGVELHPTEIRVVELSPAGNDWVISNHTTVLLSEGYLGEWGVNDPLYVGQALRNALDRAGISTNEAAFGLPPSYCAVRTVNVPPVAGSELNFIVAGEAEHAQVFRELNPSFGLVPLHDESLNETSGKNVLMVGAEKRVLTSVDVLASAANLRLVAVEPTHLALYRVACLQAQQAPNLVVTISESHAEFLLLDRGRLAIYRAFDLGGSIFEPGPEDERFGNDAINTDAAGMVALEIRRSTDFIAREMPENPRTEVVLVGSTHPKSPILIERLQRSARTPCRVATLEDLSPEKWGGRAPLQGADAFRYLGAYGLAVRPPLALLPDEVTVDMLDHERLRSGISVDHLRKFRLAMVASLVFLACGALAAALGSVSASQSSAGLARSEAKLAETQKSAREDNEEHQARLAQLQALSGQGLPVPGTIRSIVKAVTPSVGLTEVKLTQKGAELNGDALSEASIIAMSNALRRDPRFLNVSLTSFELVDPEDPKSGMRFRMALQNRPAGEAAPTQVAANGAFGQEVRS